MELGTACELEERLDQLFTELNEADSVLKQLKAEAKAEKERLERDTRSGDKSEETRRKLNELRRDIALAEDLIDQLIGETAEIHEETKDVVGVADCIKDPERRIE